MRSQKSNSPVSSGKCIWALIIPAALIAMSLAASLIAQEREATIAGIVSDPSNAVVNGATVTVTTLEGAEPKTMSTNMQGAYEFGGVKPGTYTIAVSHPGFETSTEDVTVASGENKKVNVALSIKVEEQQVQEDLPVYQKAAFGQCVCSHPVIPFSCRNKGLMCVHLFYARKK